MLVKLGNWLFHFRNILFPLFYAALFIPSPDFFQKEETALIIGAFIVGTGIAVRCTTIGLVYIIRGGAKRQIHAEELVTGGIYQVCRNPMYLGNILLIIGFGIFANSLLFTLIFSPLFVFFYIAIISAEENFLSGKFDQQFADYKASTNAIIPKLENLGAAFEGQTFKWGKVINKEHNSLFLYFSAILLLLLYHGHLGISLFFICEAVLVLLYALAKYLKHINFI
ncbi:MAG TPA: isoprenylcysteine carboxylmethyltransferase family protein [Bacteroidales bacterium]|nr:isoprenylcysteine carboxylmethyltransferase family protein [Bacteroidales bacterium]